MAESKPEKQIGATEKSQPEPGPEPNTEVSKSKDESKPVSTEQTADSKKKRKGKQKEVQSDVDKTTSPPTSPTSQNPASKLTPHMMDSLLEMNPALRAEFGSMDKDKAKELLKKLNVSDLLTGMAITGKNQKDMASYKFWNTQPVPRFDEKADSGQQDGPIKNVDPADVPKEPQPLMEGFEWCQLDLTQESELHEVYELLTFHYVEDDNAMFRFNYSQPFLTWALKSPGWRPEWHIGVRASKSRKLLASIFGIPVELKVRGATVKAVEINFLCVHKKLRSKRLAPILIREVTRRCNLDGIYQAVYTAGIVVPKPISTCRYFHRPIDWLKLHEVGFSPLPPGSTKARMVARNQLPPETKTKRLRKMTPADIPGVKDLLHRYLASFALSQTFSDAEISHWFLNTNATAGADQVIWTLVVSDGDGDGDGSGKITDMVSFYCLESTVIRNEGKTDGSQIVRAAYLFYYASEAAFAEREKGYKERLSGLVQDALVEAKKVN